MEISELTEEVFHVLRSALKTLQLMNVWLRCLTDEVSHAERALLKVLAPSNVPDNDVTEEVCQVLRHIQHQRLV